MRAPALLPAPAAVAGGAAVVLMAGFRIGLVPGGLIGVDLALAMIGWWFATAVRDRPTHVARVSQAWRMAWGPMLVAVMLAVGWALMAESVRLDDTVRGAAIATFGGYANWHQLSLGPVESLATRLRSPLQHTWATSVLVQCLVVWWALVALTRKRAARRPDVVDPMAAGALSVAALSFAGGLALLATGASGQALLLSTVPRGTAFFLGALVGAAEGAPLGRAIRSIGHGCRWPAVALLAVCAVAAGPATTFGRVAGVTIVPILALVVVAAWTGQIADGGEAAEGPQPTPSSTPSWWWPVLVTSWFVLTPSLALVDAAWPSSPAVLVGVTGLILAAAISVPVASLIAGLSTDTAAVERRRVLVPPLAVALFVILFSVTGAFHWEAPQPRDEWPRPAVEHRAPSERAWRASGTS